MAGNLLEETQTLAAGGGSQSVRYSYNADRRRSSLTYPDGSVLGYTYTDRGALKSIMDGQSALVSYVYDEVGNNTLEPRENLTETEHTYDAVNQLTGIEERGPSSVLAWHDYGYDEVGNRIYAIGSDGTDEVYTYDAVNQLIGVERRQSDEVAGRTAYTYDAVGNRIEVSEDGAVTRYTANELNQYVQVGQFAPHYDRNGNLMGIGDWLYRYDALNRLVVSVLPVTP